MCIGVLYEKNISEIDDEGEEDEEDNSIVLDRVGSKSRTAEMHMFAIHGQQIMAQI